MWARGWEEGKVTLSGPTQAFRISMGRGLGTCIL